MTETTEKISTEDLVLLLEKVMGIRSIVEPRDDEGYFIDQKGAIGICTGEGEWEPFAPQEDTPEGLWQAKQLAEAWCLETDGGWSFNWAARGRHVVDLYDVNEPDPIITKRAETLPLAIVRAVLAAAKGAALAPSLQLPQRPKYMEGAEDV